MGVVGDALSHGQTVKSFAAEPEEARRLEQSMKPFMSAQVRSWTSSLPADNGRMLLAAVATAAILVLTASLYRDNSISIAVVALIQLYVIKMIAATQEIAEIVKQYELAMGGAYQPVRTWLIKQTVTDTSQPRSIPKNQELTIEFRDVTFRYPEASPNINAVRNFNLTITPGEKVGLVGYSGSGKTTLTKLLLRFMDVTNGSVRLGNIDIRDLPQQDVRQHIAYVPQEPLLFHRSMYDNIAYAKPHAPKKAILAAAKLAYVDEFAKELPDGYDTRVGERGVKLSGGQRQRVAIARALLKDAPILVLDEATSALDSRSEKYIQQALWRLMKDRTALVIAHRLSTIQRMDRIVVMDKGRVVQIGTHDQLLQDNKGIYAKLWSHQTGGYVGAEISQS
jgi:ATP-binding cassette subfamily B protein